MISFFFFYGGWRWGTCNHAKINYLIKCIHCEIQHVSYQINTYWSWIIDDPKPRGWGRLLDPEPTGIDPSVFEVHCVTVGTTFLQDPKLNLLWEQDQPTHVGELVLSLYGGPCSQGGVDFSPHWLLNGNVLSR